MTTLDDLTMVRECMAPDGRRVRQCEYCYEVAEWGVNTARGPRDMCQRHYVEHDSARRSVSLSSGILASFLAEA